LKKIIAGPFNRVEGDLEIQIELEKNRIKSARVNSPIYRGFEQILIGNDPLDAMVFTPRICGICSISHSIASARALASYASEEVPENGRLCTNLIQACENVADLFTHFYLFFMPDFAHKEYKNYPWYPKIERRFQAIKGTAGTESLKVRTNFLQIMGILAGKWPHSLSIQPGGTSRPVEKHEQVKLLSMINNFRNFLEKKLFGLPLPELLAISSKDDLIATLENNGSDFGDFLALSTELKLDLLGTTRETLMSYGSYPKKDGYFLEPGLWREKKIKLNPELITEDISHAWYSASPTILPPERGKTLPNHTKKDGYSWIKAPRLDGQVVEVGSLARLVIDGDYLLVEEYKKNGSSVQNRIIARLLELAKTVVVMENWIKKIKPGNPFCNPLVKPVTGKGMGLTEAARGGLGHWVQLEDGKIENYQIIAPTTWNFSPRDQNKNPGVLEKALYATTLANPSPNSVEIQHIVRSFDPCMSCTVH
jgi:hydrogenase large subunit